MTMETPAATGQAAYPLRMAVARSEGQSRLTNFPLGIGTLIRGILAIPHIIILYFLQLVGGVVWLIATFAILFTGRYPRGLFSFYVSYMRWLTNAMGYLIHLYDQYPPFGLNQDPTYPVEFDVEYPERLSRWLNLPIIGFYVKAILALPHLVILVFLGIAAFVVTFIALFAILFTGSYPAGMHRFVVGVFRWQIRVNAYTYSLTDRYPPFSLSEAD